MIDKKFKSNTVISYLSQAGVVACGFAFTTLVTQYAGITVFGILGILTAFSSVLSNLLTFRTNEAIVVFYKRGESAGDLGLCKFALLVGILLDVLVGSLLFALVYNSASLIAEYLIRDTAAEAAIQLFAGTLFFQFFRGAPLGYLVAKEHFKSLNLLTLSEHLIKVGITAGIILGSGGINLHQIISAGLVAAMSASVTVYVFLLVKLVHSFIKIPVTINRGLIVDYLSFSLSTFLSTALKAGNQNIDTLVLGLVTDARLVGIYALFRQFLAPLAFISGPFATLAYPRFVQAVVDRRQTEIRAAIRQVNVKLIMVYAGALILMIPAMIGYGWWLKLDLQSADYLTFAIMIGSAFLSGQLWWARPFSNAVNPNFSLQGNLFATLFLLTCIYPATSHFGLLGTSTVMLILGFGATIFWNSKLAKSH